jgi:hypothetical protein
MARPSKIVMPGFITWILALEFLVAIVDVKMSGLAPSFSAITRIFPAVDDFSASRARVLSYPTNTAFSATISALQIQCPPK